MYGKGGDSIVGGGVVTGAGVVILPHTVGNTIGQVLAYAAITIGGTAVISQVIVRVLRRKYNA